MPLLPGKSKYARSENIHRLIKEGYPQKQAVAISYSVASKKKRPSVHKKKGAY